MCNFKNTFKCLENIAIPLTRLLYWLVKFFRRLSVSIMGEPRIGEGHVLDIPRPKILLPQLSVPQKNSLSSSQPSSPVALTKGSGVKYNCLCSPTTHAGSFRCRLHRNNMPRSSKSVGSKLNELAGNT